MNRYIFLLVTIELLIVAYVDLQKKKISNLWSLFNLAVAISLIIGVPALYPLDFSLLIFPLGFIVIGFLLFLGDVMGAGDSKFLASLFLIIPLDHQFLYFEKLVTVTMVVGSLMLIRTLIKNQQMIRAYFLNHHWKGFLELVQSRFSYAPVMFLAWLLLGASEWL